MNDQLSYIVNRSAVVSDVIEGEAVIINLESGSYYSFNSTGSALWSILQHGPASPSDIAAELAGRYSGEADTIRDAVDASLKQLLDEGLIIESPRGSASAAQPPGTSPADAPAFVAPSLEIHTDMQDFLLVDPIHEVDTTGLPAPHGK